MQFDIHPTGGGAFVLPYVIVLFLVGKPLYYMELLMGQFSSSRFEVLCVVQPAYLINFSNKPQRDPLKYTTWCRRWEESELVKWYQLASSPLITVIKLYCLTHTDLSLWSLFVHSFFDGINDSLLCGIVQRSLALESVQGGMECFVHWQQL